MAGRSIEVDGHEWKVYSSGRYSVYNRDEVSIVFEKGTGRHRVRRVTRFRPIGAQRRDAIMANLSSRELERLFHVSQPAWTSPEGRRTAELFE